ncbi:ATPase with chaperone activity [Caldimonas thermodepolymerans]|uniref:ATPase with chaperone activity n=1 Tax=Caldimonas thermodepolymerans TaxID=215580 RepID=UPI0024922DB5|nr:ATPase with chaperone activity [Caldimonas thermodepolymerans]
MRNRPVSDDHQLYIPPSFVDLYVDPGRLKPREPRDVIAQRYEYCEDLAQMLTETARDKLWQLHVTEADVLQRIHQGLAGGDAGVDAAEARWVVRRLAELLGWDDPFPSA